MTTAQTKKRAETLFWYELRKYPSTLANCLCDLLDQVLFVCANTLHKFLWCVGFWIIGCTPRNDIQKHRDQIQPFFGQHIDIFALICRVGSFVQNPFTPKHRKSGSKNIGRNLFLRSQKIAIGVFAKKDDIAYD